MNNWIRDILTFLAAFLGFWILMYNLHCEEVADAVPSWNVRNSQMLVSKEWAEPWLKEDHTFFREHLERFRELEDLKSLVSEFNLFSSRTNLGLQIDSGQFGELAGDLEASEKVDAVRYRLIWMLEEYLKSELVKQPTVPGSPSRMDKFGQNLLTPWDEDREKEFSRLLNAGATCGVKASFVRQKRELRRLFKPFCHPLNIWGRIKDKYEFDLYWSPGQASPHQPLVVIKKASNIQKAQEIAQILQKESFDLGKDLSLKEQMEPEFSCLWLKATVTLDLGNNGIAFR
ncbi:MAG: hypothetical protein H6581_02860 [Bacteroidia bacterium]|nr:hypothetical protein [Bacteroidia bacterium]